jgi:hypothetical protein
MVSLTQNKLQKLYEFDDYLWLEETVKLLKNKDWNNLDRENLIEELESLGNILLLEYWQQEYERNYRHWEGEIIAFRDDLNHSLTTRLKNKLTQEIETIYNVAVKLVSKKTELSQNQFPDNCPYFLEQLLDDNWYPEK